MLVHVNSTPARVHGASVHTRPARRATPALGGHSARTASLSSSPTSLADLRLRPAVVGIVYHTSISRTNMEHSVDWRRPYRRDLVGTAGRAPGRFLVRQAHACPRCSLSSTSSAPRRTFSLGSRRRPHQMRPYHSRRSRQYRLRHMPQTEKIQTPQIIKPTPNESCRTQRSASSEPS